MKTDTINVSKLRNSEHYMFYEEFIAIVMKFGASLLKIDLFFNAFLDLFKEEDEAYKTVLKSAITEEIEDADHKRDTIFRGLVDAVKSALNHFKDDVRKAAKQLKVVLDSYGNVAQKPYNQESAEIINLLQDFRGKYLADAQKVGIIDWADELDATNNAFIQLYRDRLDESSEKPATKLKEIRPKVDTAFKDITARIDARALLDEDGDIFNDFIVRLNVMIKKYNDILARRNGGK